MAHKYVGLGKNGKKIFLYKDDLSTKVRQVLWGDWLRIDKEKHETDPKPGWLPVIWAPKLLERQWLYIKEEENYIIIYDLFVFSSFFFIFLSFYPSLSSSNNNISI